MSNAKALIIFVLSTLVTSVSSADFTSQELQGVGIDGKRCSVTIRRSGLGLESVTLEGATEEHEASSEDSAGSAGTKLVSDGGATVLDFIEKDPSIGNAFSHRYHFLGDGETYTWDTSEILFDRGEEPPLSKIVAKLELSFDRRMLVKVKATIRSKGLIFEIASKTFTCENRYL